MSSPSVAGQRLGFDRETQIVILVVGLALGIASGLAIPTVATWVSDVPWVPFRGPLTFLGSASTAWALAAGGGVLGAVFAIYVIYESPVLYVSEDQIEVHSSGDVRRIAREQIVGVFREGGKIVVEGSGGRTLFRGDVEGGRAVVREAFVTRGYPWEAE